MSGSWLGRGRLARLALLGCGTLVVIIIMIAYHSTSTEMARLRDLHLKCAQQQEALAAQLQVIYEYKVQLEKTLSNEKSANAAAKEELQQKATRERSLRDKDSLEAMQRFNALQQNYKLLQTEQQDLKDDCRKKESVALENAKRLEATLLELRQQQKRLAEERDGAAEGVKNKYLALLQEKEQLEERHAELRKATAESSGKLEHLQKQVMQLQRELDAAKKASHFSIGGLRTENSILPRSANEADLNNNNNNNNNNNDVENNNNNGNKPAGVSDNNSMQVIRPSSQQQVSSPSSDIRAGENPQPLQAPQNHQNLDDTDNTNNNNNLNGNNDANNANNKNDESPPDETRDDVRFENRDGNIVPAGPSETKEQQQRPVVPNGQGRAERIQDEPAEANEIAGAEQQKHVLAPPEDSGKLGRKPDAVVSSRAPPALPVLRPRAPGQALDGELNSPGDPNDFD